MRKFGMKATSLLLVLMFPYAVMAADAGAMVFPSGSVSVNGTALAKPAAVFAGDRIQTAEGAVAVTMSGSTVQLTPKSSLTYQKDAVILDDGGARVTTSSALAGRYRNLWVKPVSSGSVQYEVARREGKILVAALQGKLQLSDGTQTMFLEAGKAVSMPVQDEKQEKQDERKKGAGTVITGGGTGPASNVSLSTLQTTVLYAGSVLGGALLTYYIIGGSRPAPVSPAQ